jgi:hypothetical protein
MRHACWPRVSAGKTQPGRLPRGTAPVLLSPMHGRRPSRSRRALGPHREAARGAGGSRRLSCLPRPIGSPAREVARAGARIASAPRGARGSSCNAPGLRPRSREVDRRGSPRARRRVAPDAQRPPDAGRRLGAVEASGVVEMPERSRPRVAGAGATAVAGQCVPVLHQTARVGHELARTHAPARGGGVAPDEERHTHPETRDRCIRAKGLVAVPTKRAALVAGEHPAAHGHGVGLSALQRAIDAAGGVVRGAVPATRPRMAPDAQRPADPTRRDPRVKSKGVVAVSAGRRSLVAGTDQ